jgi:hypothetical protein
MTSPQLTEGLQMPRLWSSPRGRRRRQGRELAQEDRWLQSSQPQGSPQ